MRYGCMWPDNSETGPITDHQRLAAAYAKDHEGVVVEYPSNQPKERKVKDEKDIS